MKRARRILMMVLRTGIAIGLLVYLGASGAINGTALLGLVAAWPIALGAFVLLFAAFSLTAWRLCVLLRPRSLHLSLSASVRLTLMGTFFSAFLPSGTGGDVVRIYYAAKGNAGRRVEVATVMLFDRAVGMFTLVILPLLVVPLFGKLVLSLKILRLLLVAAGVVAGTMLMGVWIGFADGPGKRRLVGWIFQSLPLGRYAVSVLDTVYAYRHNRGKLLKAVGIALLAHTLFVAVALLVAQAICPAGAVWPMSVLIPLGFLANALPLTPGGLGVGEAALDKLFGLAGLTGGAETLLGLRLLTISMGLIGLMFYLCGGQRFVHDLSSPVGKTE